MRGVHFFAFASFIVLTFSQCKKNPSSTQLIPNFYFINGDTSGFSKNAVLFSSSDTLTYKIVISSTYFLSQTATVTIGTADNYRDSFNLYHGTSYESMPAAAYEFPTSIEFGTSSIFDTVAVTFHKSQLAPGKNYMLPIKINDVSIYSVSAFSSVIYLHIESSKLSGIYVSTGTRILYNGDASNNDTASVDSFTIVKNLVPQSEVISQLDYANMGSIGWKYYIGFSTDIGQDSAFYASPNITILNSVQPGSFKVITDTFDSTTKDIHIKTSYKNLSGDERIVEEFLTLQ